MLMRVEGILEVWYHFNPETWEGGSTFQLDMNCWSDYCKVKASIIAVN